MPGNFTASVKASDRMDAIRFADYYDSYRLIAAYLVYLDYALDTEPVK